MRRVIDTKRRRKKLDAGFARWFPIKNLARFKGERGDRHNVMATAEAIIAAWIVAACVMVVRTGNA